RILVETPHLSSRLSDRETLLKPDERALDSLRRGFSLLQAPEDPARVRFDITLSYQQGAIRTGDFTHLGKVGSNDGYFECHGLDDAPRHSLAPGGQHEHVGGTEQLRDIATMSKQGHGRSETEPFDLSLERRGRGALSAGDEEPRRRLCAEHAQERAHQRVELLHRFLASDCQYEVGVVFYRELAACALAACGGSATQHGRVTAAWYDVDPGTRVEKSPR